MKPFTKTSSALNRLKPLSDQAGTWMKATVPATSARKNSMHERVEGALKNGSLPRPLDAACRSLYDLIIGQSLSPEKLANAFVEAKDSTDWQRCVHHVIVQVDVAAVRLISKAINLDFIDEKLGFSCFELAGAVMSWRPSEECSQILGILSKNMDKRVVLPALKELIKHSELSPSQLKSICIRLVKGSAFPISSSLEMAAVFEIVAKKSLTRMELYNELRNFFSGFALELLHSLECNHLVAIALESPDELGMSAMNVALQTNNKHFVCDMQVTRILNAMWQTPQYMCKSAFTDSGEPAASAGPIRMLLTSPKKFFASNVGKFLMRAIGFMCLVVSFTWLVFQRVDINAPLQSVEFLIWIIVLGFIVNEISEASRQGVKIYWESGWNQTDCAIYLIFILMFITRIWPIDGWAKHELYAITISINGVLLWVRVMFVFVLKRSLGPLISAMAKMLRDIYNFLFILLAIMIGFALGMYRLGSGKIDRYETVFGSLLSLYRASLGEFYFDEFDVLVKYEKFTAKALLLVYLTISVLIMLNILVAILADTYAGIQHKSEQEYLFGRAKMIIELNESANSIPPPFNAIVFALFWPLTLLKLVLSLTGHFNSQSGPVSNERDRSNHVDVSRGGDHAGAEENGENEQHHITVSPDVEEEDAFDENMDYGGSCQPWICARCLQRNDYRTQQQKSKMVRNWIEGIEGVVPTELKLVNGESLCFCRHCFRLKSSLNWFEYRREQTSFAVFIMIFWIPATILLFIPEGILWLIERFIAVTRANQVAHTFGRVALNLGGVIMGVSDDIAPKSLRIRKRNKPCISKWVKNAYQHYQS